MKVLILSTRDIVGGAARDAFRLYQGLHRIGVDTKMQVLAKSSDAREVLAPVGKKEKALAKLYPNINGVVLNTLYGKSKRRVFSTSITPFDISKKINQVNPDIVNLHWVTDGFLKVEDLAKIRQPIVWTLHDMWAFTGGCHYDLECGKYVDKCGACPALNSKKENDISRWLYNRKKKAFQKANMTIITSSRWLGSCAAKSSLLADKRIEVFPNGIDTDVFKPIDKVAARKILNLPLDKKLVLFGAMNPQSNPVKGYPHLAGAINKIESDEINFLIFGTSYPQQDLQLKHQAHYLGRVSDDLSLSVIYSAADVVVVPSIQENLSNVIMESLACGTPVIGFNIGGNPDMIEHKKNGYLAKPFDTTDLAHGIEWVISDPAQWQALSTEARESVIRKYSLEKIARDHEALFQELLSEKIR